jgi:hypothetical protein
MAWGQSGKGSKLTPMGETGMTKKQVDKKYKKIDKRAERQERIAKLKAIKDKPREAKEISKSKHEQLVRGNFTGTIKVKGRHLPG